VAVPQAVTPAAEAEACASPRLCAEVYPSAARPDGLLWIWATAGDFERAAATPVGGHTLLDTPADLTFITPWYARDIPCDTAEFLENVVDPCHVAFSHHGVLGSRYAPPWQAMKPAARPVAGHEETDPAVAEAEDAGGFAVKVAMLGATRPKVKRGREEKGKGERAVD
jgi:phenylpropionate dioxygenase-like ring-hydroxylating dioxygenase large terminal subunit